MSPLKPRLVAAVSCVCLSALFTSFAAEQRLAYLDETDPFYVGLNFPKLTTPQWIGEPGVEAVVILSIDDMRDHRRYEAFLRPIIERLKKIDGRAPVSIFSNALDPEQPHYQSWIKEGLSLEIHTLSHPCPLLARSNFVAAAETYHGCVDLLHRVPGNKPTAFRMPCCDSMNSPSPRFYAEIFNRTNKAGQFLTIDSSVMNITTPKDPSLPRELVVDGNGKEKFRKYLPFPSFATTIEDYPYPYVIGRLCWEFPAMAPSDWEAQNLHGTNNPVTVADWKSALDAAVIKQGTFNFIFHPHGWIRPDQLVEFIDYAVQKHGRKVQFLNFREAHERLTRHLLAGQPLRSSAGDDNGVRLLDLNQDGFLDVTIGNAEKRLTRVWLPQQRAWIESEFPAQIVSRTGGESRPTGVRFGAFLPNGQIACLLRNETAEGAWRLEGTRWVEDKTLLRGLDIDARPVFTSREGRDQGARFRDVDRDGRDELIVGNATQRAVFSWSPEEKKWKRLPYALPAGTSIVDAQGRDAGLRFVDINRDGYEDVLFSNPERYSLHLFIAAPKPNLGWERGWSFQATEGKRGDAGEIPMIVRGGEHPNNGAWFHSNHLWIQNEDVAHLPDKVDRRSFESLLIGKEPPPKTREEALKSFEVRPGFKIECVAAEPLVIDPVAFEWGADGKLWVAEMRDYPLGIDGKGKPGGAVKFLEDTNDDGNYDQATVFLDGLNFPTGVMPWRNGVLISAAPEILYAEDTNGDGRADVRRTILRGFGEGNQQHRVNGFEYGLDNWVYAANGDSGGMIRSEAGGAAINLRGQDLRFNPDDGRFEAIAGQTQFGRRRDDWGHWFGNNNPTWGWHYYLPDDRLPRLAEHVRTPRHLLANYPQAHRVFAISRPQQRFNWPDAVRQVTAANSATPYRDELFGSDFGRSLFISEPANNVVHREDLEPHGITFTSRRAAGEQTREFLASTDNWFRPTMLKTGPDGALYIADMYRLVLEHPEYFPDELKMRPDLRAGEDKGRIYRVAPEGAKLRSVPRLDKLDVAGLAAALDSPNGWQRDTAQRLLVHAASRYDAGAKTWQRTGAVSGAATKTLADLALNSARPQTRLQALCTLDGTGELMPAILIRALGDAHESVREHAVRLADDRLSGLAERPAGRTPTWVSELEQALVKLAHDPSVRVRHRVLLALGGSAARPDFAPAVTAIAVQDYAREHCHPALLYAASTHAQPMLQGLLRSCSHDPQLANLLGKMAGVISNTGNKAALTELLQAVSTPGEISERVWQWTVLDGLLNSLAQQQLTLSELAARSGAPMASAVRRLSPLFDEARSKALDAQAPTEHRLAAIRLLGRGSKEQDEDLRSLATLLRPQETAGIWRAAMARLAGLGSPRVADALLEPWTQLSPEQRLEALNVLLSRPAWAESLLRAAESGRVAPAQISPAHRQRLLTHSQSAIRKRASKLLAAAPDRKSVLQQYQIVAELKGNSAKGAVLFRQHCASCHRFQGEGANVGPDLGTVANKSVDLFLVAILHPNEAVETRYLSYTATTKSGRELTGIIISEGPNALTLQMAGGTEETIARGDLIELRASGLSMMPEGFETALAPQDMADLIDFLATPSATP